MSLVNALMNGTYGASESIDASKYTHDNGALRIATESTEELYDIFLEFYDYEQAELAAVHEGVALENSQFVPVAEAAVGNAITKIKEFFKKLWAKVKAFFHAIKRYIDSIFMKGKDFVKKYKEDIRKADTNLRDFSYKMFKYNNEAINGAKDKDAATKTVDAIFDQFQKSSTQVTRLMNSFVNDDTDKSKTNPNGQLKTVSSKSKQKFSTSMGVYDNAIEAMKEVSDRDKIAKDMASKRGISGVSEGDDFAQACYKYFRNGAEDKEDKQDIDIKNLSSYADIISTDMASIIDSASTATDRNYKKALDQVNKAESEISNLKGDDSTGTTYSSKSAELLRYLSSAISTAQGFDNAYFNAWKAVVSERDSAYKSMILAGISNARKAAKNK